MATIRDVARMAGVSTATVSHVINGTRPVAESTRKLVLQAMDTLHYVPSAFGRGLRKNTLRTIGFLVADMTNPFFSAVFQGVERAARNAHYTVIVSHSGEDPEREDEALASLLSKGVDGILLAPAHVADTALELYSRIPVPLVMFDRRIPQGHWPCVISDSRSAVTEAIRFFQSRGHTEFGLIAGRSGLSTTTDRLEGFLNAVPASHRTVFYGNSRYESGVTAADWLAEHPHWPSVVIVGNNLMAMGLVSTLQTRYPHILNAIEIVTLDAEPWMTFVRPPISMIAQPTDQMGEIAMQLLIQQIQGEDSPLLTSLPCRWLPHGQSPR